MEQDWRSGVVGNIVHEHQDENGKILYGTKEFTGGTKVYLDGKNWLKNPKNKITVIGLGRFKRYEIVSVPVNLIENVRFQMVRKPAILSILSTQTVYDGWFFWGKTASDKREAKQFAEDWERLKEQVK